MQSGDVVRVDFGVPAGSEPGFIRPAVVVTAGLVLAERPRTIHVVPLTSDVRGGLPSELTVEADGLRETSAAQCHLITVISPERVADEPMGNVGAAALAQVRAVITDLLDIS